MHPNFKLLDLKQMNFFFILIRQTNELGTDALVHYEYQLEHN